MPSSDDAIVQRVRSGDTEAFAELVARYQDAVYAIALGMLRNTDDAQDVAQSCFVRAFSRLGELRHGNRFGSWLYAIVRSGCQDWLREQSRGPALVGDPAELESANPSGLPGDSREQRALARDDSVRRAVDSLPPPYRAVVTLRYLAELSFAEVAEALGVSVANARVRWHRARKMLRERLPEPPSDEEAGPPE